MIFYHLGTHPEWQLRILSDINHLLSLSQPDSSSPGLAAVSNALLTSCASLNAAIKESLRVSPPFPASFPRDIAPGAENVIPGLQAPLPTGTTVQANVYVISHEKDFWGDDADVWNPERWMAVEEGNEKRLEDGFLIFGRGHRACVGRHISFMALRKVVHAVSQLLRYRRTLDTNANFPTAAAVLLRAQGQA